MWGTHRISLVYSEGSSPILGGTDRADPNSCVFWNSSCLPFTKALGEQKRNLRLRGPITGDHVNRTGPHHLPLGLPEAEKKLHPGWRDQEIRRSQRWYWRTQPEKGRKATLRQKPPELGQW